MDNGTVAEPETIRCSECNTALTEGQDRETTEDAVFCRPCFNNLTAQLHQAVEVQGQEINYPMAAVGGLAGAAVGVLVWWGFTVVTQIAFGLVAVVIGFAVGKGILLMTGNKRAQSLQILSVVVSGLSFFYASYLVNRTFILRAFAEDGEEMILPLLPSPELLVRAVGINFGVMDLVFLAIVLYQAWKIPAPLQLAD